MNELFPEDNKFHKGNTKDVKWCAIEDGTPGNGTGRHIACFILDELKPEKSNQKTLFYENSRRNIR